VIDAIVAANTGHALAYGSDPWTAQTEAMFRDIFGPQSEAFLVWNGTGANVMGLATMLRPAEFVLCTRWAHIAVDETGAPERILGAKLVPVETADAKIVPDQIVELAHLQGDMHHAQPGVVSITQSTELGTVYTVDEVAALCDAAHRLGMLVHMDGARLANATAALGGTIATTRSFTVDAGVDVLSFGGTKAGLAGGEAVIFLDPALANARQVHPQAGHPAAVEDALHRCTVQCPARRRSVDRVGGALERDGNRAVPAHLGDRRSAPLRAPGGQQRVPDPSPRGDRTAAELVLSSGIGTSARGRSAG
jgi:threonine aldolase